MAQMLLSRVRKSIQFISSLLLFWVISGIGYAQSTLLPGDLAIVTINPSVQEIEIVPLIDLEPQTNFELISESGGTIVVTIQQQVTAGNSVLIGSNNSEGLTIEGEFLLEKSSDLITISQSDIGISRLLFAISWGFPELETTFPDGVPFVPLKEGENHQYFLKNGASGTYRMIRDMIADPSNWKTSDVPFPRIQTSFRVLSSPVIVFDDNFSTVMEGDSIPLNVAIYEHDGSRLTVDVVLNEAFSTSDSNDVLNFEKYTYNFTGLIGDAIYQISVPLHDDDFFEDRETAFFELANLSSGNFGDFVSHAAFIQDNEIPDVSITSFLSSTDIDEQFIEIQNNERVYVNVSGWNLKTNSGEFLLGDVVELAPFEKKRLFRVDFQTSTDSDLEEFLSDSDNSLSFYDVLGNEVVSWEMQMDRNVNRVEFSEVDVDLPNSSNAEINTLNTAQANLTENGLAKTNPDKKEYKPGWYPINETEISFDEEFEAFYWNESIGKFRKVEPSNIDSLSGLALFKYFDSEQKGFELELAGNDTISLYSVEGPSVMDWEVTLSATDSDGNGIINDNEGYNFVQYKGLDTVSVNYLIATLEEELGDTFLYPGVFSVIENGLPFFKEGDQKISPEEFLWVKADSIFERKELDLSPGLILNDPFEINTTSEAISNFRISLSSDSTTSYLSLNFYEDEFQKPRSIINPILDLQLNMNDLDKPAYGAYFENNWVNSLNLGYSGQLIYSFPLGILYQERGELSINIEDWNMEGGWRLFLEDVISKERIELVSGIEVSFEHNPSNQRIDDLEEERSQFPKFEVVNQYNLILTSPDYIESLFDQPDQIELNQNYPNPFNPETTITFYLPESVDVKLSVFNVVGQPISVLEEGVLSAGEHQYLWNASGYPSGMYIYQLEVGNKVMTRKMTLVK